MININLEKSNVNKHEILLFKERILKLDQELEKDVSKKTSMAKWMYYPQEYDVQEYKRMKEVSEEVKKNSDILVVIGIGGSYLGTKAILDIFKSNLNKEKGDTEIIFVGNNMSTKYIQDVIRYVENKDFTINVISKSGGTLEPAIAFRIFKELLVQKYPINEVNKRIIVTTDETNGILREISKKEKYETFYIPQGIGGRYSVLTPVGMFPLMVAGIDTDSILKGAKKALVEYSNSDLEKNNCYKYAVLRHLMYEKYKKDIELFVTYEPSFTYLIEWLKQLFNESEGKDKKGLFTTGTVNTTDLHSIGQNIQDGKRNMFETVLWVDSMNTEDILFSEVEGDYDKLNYLAGKSLNDVNKIAMIATTNAHNNGNVPNILIQIDKNSEESIGQIIYFFEKACAIYCMLNEVNPFDQPGVEEYKNIMFKLLKEK